MSDKHSPGPWVLSEFTNQDGAPLYEFSQKDRYGGFIASIDTGLGGLHPDENRANARLIAAAPDLLEALEELADLMDAVHSGEYRPDSFTTQPARAALAKVKGEPAPTTEPNVVGRPPDRVPAHCPITELPFFCMTRLDGKLVPVYGGPFDVYTIPVPEADSDSGYKWRHHDQDAGGWVDGWEHVPQSLIKAAGAPTTERS